MPVSKRQTSVTERLPDDQRIAVFEEWQRRLESGDYKQGSGFLRVNDNYCCLGVLVDVLHDLGHTELTLTPVDVDSTEYGFASDDIIYAVEGEHAVLPESIYGLVNLGPEGEYGWTDMDGAESVWRGPLHLPTSERSFAELTSANDGPWSFRDIAGSISRRIEEMRRHGGQADDQ